MECGDDAQQLFYNLGRGNSLSELHAVFPRREDAVRSR